MSWLDHTENGTFLRRMYSEECDTLGEIELHGIEAHRDGPRLLLTFDVFQFPTNPPRKWTNEGCDTLQIRLMCSAVSALQVSGWSTSNVGRLLVEPELDRLRLRFRSESASMSAVVQFLRIDGLSPYHGGEHDA